MKKAEKPKTTEQPVSPTVECGQCHKEIAQVESMTPEGQDYALFFCGFECYEQWQQDAANAQE